MCGKAWPQDGAQVKTRAVPNISKHRFLCVRCHSNVAKCEYLGHYLIPLCFSFFFNSEKLIYITSSKRSILTPWSHSMFPSPCTFFRASAPRIVFHSDLGGGGCVLVTKLCPIPATTWTRNLPGSSVHGTLQARILEWVAISFSRGSSRPRK